jgi:single-stranded DNA-binding protein
VVIVGKGHSNNWEDKERGKQYGRVIDADESAVDLSRVTVTVTRNGSRSSPVSP